MSAAHRVELFWRGSPNTYGYQCLDCDREVDGRPSEQAARQAATAHGVVVDAPPTTQENAMQVHNPQAIGDLDWDPVVQLTPQQMAAFGVCRGGKDTGGPWCGGVNGYHATDCRVRPEGAPTF